MDFVQRHWDHTYHVHQGLVRVEVGPADVGHFLEGCIQWNKHCYSGRLDQGILHCLCPQVDHLLKFPTEKVLHYI